MKIQPTSTIHNEPYIGYYRNFLSAEECDYILLNQEFNQLRYKVDSYNNSVQDENFTLSYGRHPTMDEILHIDLINKIKNAFDLESATQAETFHLAKYPDGGYLVPHHDYRPNSRIDKRFATFVLWLNDDFNGGELHFPRLNLQIRPKKGCGVFFRYGKNANNDIMIHESKVNTGGPKYMLPIFMRVAEFMDEYKQEWKNRYNLESIDF
jgi:prolyl 4-hydroxylase